MKAFFVTLLLLTGVFLAYDYFIAPPGQRLVFVERSAPEAPPAPVAGSPPEAAPSSPPPGAAPAPARSAPPAASEDFVPPAIASLEEATQNWTVIPERAFPRPVVLKQPVAIRMAAGSGQLAAGTTALALGAAAGQLTVAPNEGSPARGTLPVTATDLPDQIRPAYEKWKQHRIGLARQSWEARRRGAQAVTVTAAATASAGQVDPAGKPVANAAGGYDLLLASMRAGQVSEIKPDNILHWGQPRPGPVDGQPGWLIEVLFHTLTMFGPFDVQAQAQIRDGKVVRWIYTGSGEEVL